MSEVRGRGNAWTLAPTRRWLSRCDSCRVFRAWADYFEVYRVPFSRGRAPFNGSNPLYELPLVEGDKSGWWWECERCLLETVTNWGEATITKLEEQVGAEHKHCRLHRCGNCPVCHPERED